MSSDISVCEEGCSLLISLWKGA